MKSIEEVFFDFYKSISAKTVEKIIPFIDLYRSFKNKPKIPLKEKLARIDFPKLDNVIMIHGVSVGEIQSLEKLVKKIKENFAGYSLVITAGTVTGLELAHKKYDEIADFITYFPLDIYEVTKLFLDKLNPKAILIAETELWPNFIYSAKEKNIPLFLINARLSDKSYPSYLKIRKFLAPVLNNFDGIYCQSEIDRNRFLSIGANKEKCEIMHNLKFEIEKKECDIDLKEKNYKVLIAGSTHSGEDEIVFETYEKLKSKIDNLKLILAPRHLTRLDEILSILRRFNINYGFRTKKDDFNSCDMIILDTLGELSKIYSVVDVAFIGGSFNNTGGHNPLEAAIYSKPTVSGPSIKNFRDIYSILEHDEASFVVQDEEEFYNILEKLFSDEEFYKRISKNCSQCFENQQGALDFVINKLKNVLKTK